MRLCQNKSQEPAGEEASWCCSQAFQVQNGNKGWFTEGRKYFFYTAHSIQKMEADSEHMNQQYDDESKHRVVSGCLQKVGRTVGYTVFRLICLYCINSSLLEKAVYI